MTQFGNLASHERLAPSKLLRDVRAAKAARFIPHRVGGDRQACVAAFGRRVLPQVAR